MMFHLRGGREHTALHESAHALVAVHHGLELVSVCIVPHATGEGAFELLEPLRPAVADCFAAGPLVSGLEPCRIDLEGVHRNSRAPLENHMASAGRIIAAAGPKWHRLQQALLEAERLTGDEVRQVLR